MGRRARRREIDTVFDPEEVIPPGFGLGTPFSGFYEFDPAFVFEPQPEFFVFLQPLPRLWLPLWLLLWLRF